MKDNVIISSHNLDWENIFLSEAEVIKNQFGSAGFFIDHVGSTSVKNLSGKPIVDILISVQDWSLAEKIANGLRGFNYHISEVCESTPRFFLTKYLTDISVGFHVHICEPDRKWAQDMLDFKAELSDNPIMAEKYTELKYKLAAIHYDDVEAYSRGKKDFIEENLRCSAVKFNVDRLLTHQTAELDKADKLRIWMIVIQFLVAIVAAISVYFNDSIDLLVIALVAFLLLGTWLCLGQFQQRYRSSGDQIRRVVLLMSGLNKMPSEDQQQRIIKSFNVSIAGKPLSREEDRFATREFPGCKRLAELIEESAFWTSDLQHASAKIMKWVLWVSLLTAFVLSVIAIISATHEWLIASCRVLIAVMVFFISSDVLGLLFSYRDSASSIDEIFRRVRVAALRDHPESDLLLLVSDYNAAIERAPSPLPFLIDFRYDGLSKRWNTYKQIKRANTGSQ